MGRQQNDATIKQLQSVQPRALSSKPHPQKPHGSKPEWLTGRGRSWLGKKGVCDSSSLQYTNFTTLKVEQTFITVIFFT